VKLARIILVLLAAVVLICLGPSALQRHDARIDALVDFRSVRVPVMKAAIEREVAEAELALYGAELVPALRAELLRASRPRSKFAAWI